MQLVHTEVITRPFAMSTRPSWRPKQVRRLMRRSPPTRYGDSPGDEVGEHCEGMAPGNISVALTEA